MYHFSNFKVVVENYSQLYMMIIGDMKLDIQMGHLFLLFFTLFFTTSSYKL